MKLRTLVAAVRSALACWTQFGPMLVWPFYTAQAAAAMYPYYTASNSSVKTMRVRFREGRNAREVLDFNLYLSPNDVWSAEQVSLRRG